VVAKRPLFDTKLELVDVQHFWLCLYEMVGMIANDRPGDNDVIFVWVSFQSCVKVTDQIHKIDGTLLKLIMQIKRPGDKDNNDPEKYERKMYDVIEKILRHIGWPKDVEYDGT
jgi:hypothetical protein